VTASAGFGAELPCTVCAGVQVSDPTTVLDSLANEPKLGDDDAFFLAWDMPLDGTANEGLIDAARRAGAMPWLRVIFRTPQPVADNLDRLEEELEELASIVRSGGDGLFVQAVWQTGESSIEIRDLAFVTKRAAVAVAGASPDANFTAGPMKSDPETLRALYREDVAAYLDLVTLAPGDDLAAAVATLTDLDPGKPLVLDALPMPEMSEKAVARVAESAAAGFAVTFLDTGSESAADFVPLKVMARELRGNLVFDPHSSPTGAHAAWAFVREDLGLRVIAEPGPYTTDLELVFADERFRSPTSVETTTGEERLLDDVSRRGGGLAVRLHEPDDVVILRLERPSAEELEAFGQQIDIGAGREISVEEILRRLQAFEDNQERRFEHLQATRSLHLRFQIAQGSFEASYRGEFFYDHDHGYDWVWSNFYAGGVKWRSKNIPKVPLIQPEKVASLPAEIQLNQDYEYRLRGTETLDGRDCWAIDFKPIEPAPGRSLYRGTVWVDQEIYARVRTRATQVGLEGRDSMHLSIRTVFTPSGPPRVSSFR